MILVLLLFLTSLAGAQEATVGTGNFGGLNDANSPATIESYEAQDLLNVESNLLGTAIIKRKGFTQEAALSVSTGPVLGSHFFLDSNGNNVVVVCQDRNCAKSSNGGSFSNFLTTAAAGITRWQFSDINGKLYGVNDKNDPPFQYDNTTFTSPATMPSGSLIELTKDRLAIAGTTANPNRVSFSQSGTYTNFTTGPNSADPWTEDFGTPGDKITAIKYDRGRFYVFKRNSIVSCILQDQYYTRCAIISASIGTLDPLSVVSAADALYFRSQDKSYWKIEATSAGLELISKKIATFVKTQTSGSQQSNLQTSQSDWQAGSQIPSGTWDTATRSGSIFPSSTSVGNSSTASFSAGVSSVNLSLSDYVGLSLSSSVYEDRWRNNLTAGRLGWSVTAGTWVTCTKNSNGVCTANGNPIFIEVNSNGDIGNKIQSSSITITSGAWTFDHWYQDASGNENCSYSRNAGASCWQYRFVVNAGGDYYAVESTDPATSTSTKSIGIIKVIGTTKTVLSSGTYADPIAPGGSAPPSLVHTFRIERSTAGAMYVYVDGVQNSSTSFDTSITSSVRNEILGSGNFAAGQTAAHFFGNFYAYQYASSGTFYSQTFDVTYTTPTWGPLSSTFTVLQNTEGQVVFNTSVSTSPNNDLWDAYVASSDTVRITSAQKRYIRYRLGITTFISTKTPTVTSVSLNAATTGQFLAQCISPPSIITGWGILSCSENKSGAGTLIYYTTSAATCASLPTQGPIAGVNWTSINNNATIGVSTNTAFKFAIVSSLGSSTDTAQIDACTVYWNNGAVAPPSWGMYDTVKNSMFWTTAINNATQANRLLKYDLNLNQWYIFDLTAAAPKFINSEFYFGSSSSGTWNKYGLSGVDSDNGASINAYWKSKDFSCVSPFLDSTWRKSTLVARNQNVGSLTTTLTDSFNSADSYSVSISTNSNQAFVRSRHAIKQMSPAAFMNAKIGNNAAGQPFEINGLLLDCFTRPWSAVNP